MIEQDLLREGKKIKTLGFINPENKYTEIMFKLKDDITDLDLKETFNRIYSMKIDYNNELSHFRKNNHTGILICNLKKILINKEFISLKELYFLINKEALEIDSPLIQALIQFSYLFEEVETLTYEQEVFNLLIRQQAMNPLFKKTSNRDEIIQYNSKIVNKIIKLKKSTSKKKILCQAI